MRKTTRAIAKRQLYEMPSGRKAYVMRVSYKNDEILMSYLGSVGIERESGSLFLTAKNVHRLCKYVGEVEYKDGEICENDNE
jgi:hypothetical protein